MNGHIKHIGVPHTHKDQDLGQKGANFKLKLDLNETLIKVGDLYLQKVHKGV